MRLIDADTAAEKIAEQIKMHGEDLATNKILDAFIKFLRDEDDTPTVVNSQKLFVDMRCLETLTDELDPIDEYTSLIHMRVDDVQRALYSAAQNLWILQGGTGMRMHWQGDPCPVRQGRWITMDSKTAKCSYCGWWQRAKMYYLPDDIHKFSKCYRFCTSCGARMDGGADNG